MIIDASVLLRAFFPDEEGHAQAQALIQAHVLGNIELHAPTLLAYEVASAVLQAVRRQRIPLETAQDILDTFEALAITLHPIPPTRSLLLAHRHDRSAYHAAYLSLAEVLNTQFITADRCLYNAVCQELEWVLWIDDRRLPTS